MKRVVIILAALIGAASLPGTLHAQTAPKDDAIIAVAQPAVADLLKALPRDTTLTPTQVFIDGIGQAHVRLAQFYRNIPVFEGDAIIHVDLASGKVIDTTNATLPFAPIGVTPGVSATRAAEAARTHFAQPLGLGNSKDLAILVKDGAASLAWKVRSEGSLASGHVDTIAFVGAQNARVLRSWNNLHTGTSTPGLAKGMYNNAAGAAITVDKTAATTYYLRNPGTPTYYTCDMRNGRSNCYYVTGSTTTFGTGAISSSGATAAADAEYGAEKTLSYYKTRFSRSGIDNANMSTYSRVHYSRSYENAFWTDSCKCMTYGDGASTFFPLVSIDVAGHEMSHGVTSRSANLTYSGESGGLNEATSDIFGTMVEFYANDSFDKPDYKIGEMIYRSNWNGSTNRASFNPVSALRYMYNPEADGGSKGCYYSGIGNIDVHYSSGVANHFFYLLAEGSSPAAPLPASPVCANTANVTAVTGIGRDKAEQIWYRALTVYMTSSTTYADARIATLKAAADLDKQNGWSTAATVAAAWSAVNVN